MTMLNIQNVGKMLLAVLLAAVTPFMTFTLSAAEGGAVYDEVEKALSAYPHRFPGSPEYYSSIDALEKVLVSHGLKVNRQYFRTYVPEITKSVFKVDGKDVQLYSLSPNNLALSTTGPEAIEGELIYLPKEELGKSYGDITDKIVLLDWGENEYPKTLFTEGARAIVFVGNDKATQWDIAKLKSQYSIMYPYYYMERSEAEKNNLLVNGARGRKAVMEVNSRWNEVDGINLWVEIKPETLKTFELNQPEAVIYGARLDTFGVVPGLVKGSRETANMALLAETAVALSKKTDMPRTAFAVFYGASYNAYDSLRNFLFPVSRREAKASLDMRSYLEGYKAELKDTDTFLDILAKSPIVRNEDSVQYKVRLLLRDAVIKDYNGINYRLTNINSELRKIDQRISAIQKLQAGEKPKSVREYDNFTPEQLASALVGLEKRIAPLKAERDNLKNVEMINVSNLRKDVNDRVITEERRELLNKYIAEVRERLELRKGELENSIRTAEDWVKIADVTGNVECVDASGAKQTLAYAFVGAYFFDFAASDQPFMFAARSYEMPHFLGEMSVSVYTQYFSVLSDLLSKASFQNGPAHVLADTLNAKTSFEALASRGLVYLPHAASLPLKIPSFTFRNIPGDYDFDEMPGDRKYDLKGLIPVADELVSILTGAPEFSMHSKIRDTNLVDSALNYSYNDGNYTGSRFMYFAPDGKEIDGPAVSSFKDGKKYSAFVYTRPYDYPRVYPIAGFSLNPFGAINQSGYTTMPLLTLDGSWGAQVDLNALRVGGVKFDEFGNVSHISSANSADYNKLFSCIGGAHVYDFAPLTTNFASFLHVVNGLTDAAFKNSNGYHRIATGDGFIYIDRPQKAKIYWDDETFVLGSTEDDPIGKGIEINAQDILNLNVSRIGIDDTIKLNLQRINALHKRNIFNSVMEGYQDKAEQHLIESKAERAAGNINKARAHELYGQTLAVRAYRPLKQTINDLVRSVLILLILTIPFSFALERLLIGATNVYKQLGWVLAFFVMTFVLLYFTHPAFALSQAPMIIFIAFFIIVMSVIVIYIVMNRFKSELMAMQGFDTSAHRVNSENSMLLAAIIIGVSSMRNRPIKTFLTILTVVLLTFTIISFASFDSTGYVRPTYIGDGSGEVRIEAFLANHLDLLPANTRAIREHFGDNYDIFQRSASYYSPFFVQTKTGPVQENILYNPKNGKTLVMEDVVGFEPGEVARSAKLERLMPLLGKNGSDKDGIPGVYLSNNATKDMGLEVGDVFYLRSMKVRLDGVFSASALDSFTYLDDGKVAPPNYKETMKAEERDIWSIMNDAMEDASNFIWSNPDYTVLTDYDTACAVNGFINAVVMYPKAGHDPNIIQDATDIAEVWFGIVYSNTAGGVHRHYFTQGYEASGLSTILVPLILGALIILSSLLGSIADREREIFTFSALGLSPKDVSVLFFAESGVYAVIGGLGGYLLSQLTTTVLNQLSKLGYIQAPEMNYSSMTTVYTILIVMTIVMLSTIYPAIKAGRSASPDVARKWKMPPPKGNILSFQFPFTVSRIDFGGILMFIGEHFSNHSDSSLGSFAASNVEITHGRSEYTDGYMLSTELTLAPFDLGVAEDFHMYSASSDIEGIDVVTVTIVRKDGSQGAWLRGNQRFVDEIRNQFLLWRSLPVETVMHYRELAKEKLNKE